QTRQWAAFAIEREGHVREWAVFDDGGKAYARERPAVASEHPARQRPRGALLSSGHLLSLGSRLRRPPPRRPDPCPYGRERRQRPAALIKDEPVLCGRCRVARTFVLEARLGQPPAPVEKVREQRPPSDDVGGEALALRVGDPALEERRSVALSLNAVEEGEQ